ncbi:maleylpyruvate isomerase family mycothiol-dependent enzyme [Mycobacterium sp. GA-2829]|uniref:maleylpyruvate isomerase family mycothiol-dependent enzyme n=1 Tax=Mycobacterium sp. GA-2829 TaxID=1772283 RepID=UPI0007403C49|nr:maleylpyruvate isomerase family mycothiol-dependent enzyme [Mycobacterium sp. GA-2829]KUI33298.1 hypothetical protein AU194_20045 [Mycobacterium sp. GA-2829]
MDDAEIWTHIDAQRAALADFLDTLTADQWATPSLCEGWSVREVAAHLTHSTESRPRMALETVKSGFRFNAMVSRLAREDPRGPDELVAALRAMVGNRRRPPGTAVADPLTDVLVHTQDIAIPLGVDRQMPTPLAVVAARRLWSMGFPYHARKRFAGTRLQATDADVAVGEGRVIEAPIRDIVLALSGRNSAVAPRV